LKKLLTPEATKWQYTEGARSADTISPDGWNMDTFFLDRPDNDRVQLELFYSYGTNPPLYASWQAYLREYQPPTLVAWGRNDPAFTLDGAHAYQRDLKDVDFNLLNTGHFALEEDCDTIAEHIRRFMGSRLSPEKEATKAEAK
jgi:pimeloyl-ACP methyl ester carboxylesterase